MTFWQYFVKDYHTIDEEKAQKAKLMVGCMGVLLILELISLFLSYFGIVIATANYASILMAGGLLLLHRVTGDETIVFILTIALAIVVLVYEIMHTGGIESFNI